jgi:N-succinyldiaminopimelate aminotransferase
MTMQSRRGVKLGSTTMTVSRLRPYATTVFAEMSALAARLAR